MNKAKSFIFISVLLLVASSALGDMLPVKVIASNRQLTVFPALVAGKYLLKTRVTNYDTSNYLFSFYGKNLENEMEVGIGDISKVNVANGLVFSNTTFESAFLLKLNYQAISARFLLPSNAEMIDISLNNYFNVSYLAHSDKTVGSTEYKGDSFISVSGRRKMSGIDFSLGYSVGMDSASSLNTITGTMVGAEYDFNISDYKSILSAYVYNWDRTVPSTYGDALESLHGSLIDETLTKLRFSGGKKTLIKYNMKYSLEDALWFINVRSLLEDSVSDYEVGVRYSFPETAGLGIEGKFTNQPGLLSTTQELAFVFSVFYIGNLSW
jgi:hypothetical protein